MTETGDFAEAIIGARTLVVEPTKTSNHETAESGVEEGAEAESAGGASGKGNGNGKP